MSMHAFLKSFGLVFAAEVGDKTQLAVISLAASERSPWAVFLGASLGLAAATGLGVGIGTLLGATLPERAIRVGAGILFMLFGAWMLAGAWRSS
jgi:putative Ca2+/H+ antiporter (TMEM165/GDT1 family)